MNILLRSFGYVTTLAASAVFVTAASAQSAGELKPDVVAPTPVEVQGEVARGADVQGPGVGLVRTDTPPDAPAGAPGTGTSSGGNPWFPVTRRDLGVFYGEGEAVGEFSFKNPHDEAVEWSNLTPSCQCASAEITVGDRLYRLTGKPKRLLLRVTKVPGQPDKTEPVQTITIGAGESGVVETHLDMHNITGPKQATLDIHSTDPTLPQTKLAFTATGAQLFTVSPKEVNLNKMTWNETREFTVTVTSPLKEEWDIIGMDDAGKAFDVTWEKGKNGAMTAWTIHGKYGPVDGEVGGGGVLRFRSNINGGASFNVRVLAFVQGPLEVKPGGFLTLGLIRQGKELTKEIVFEPNDGVDLQATNLEFQKMTMSGDFITASSRKDGNKLIVELAVAANAPKGLVKGDLVVQLNHPLVKEKRIMFNGFVR